MNRFKWGMRKKCLSLSQSLTVTSSGHPFIKYSILNSCNLSLCLCLSVCVCVPVNRGLLILLVLVAFALLYNKTRLKTLPKYSGTHAGHWYASIRMFLVCYILILLWFMQCSRKMRPKWVWRTRKRWTLTFLWWSVLQRSVLVLPWPPSTVSTATVVQVFSST